MRSTRASEARAQEVRRHYEGVPRHLGASQTRDRFLTDTSEVRVDKSRRLARPADGVLSGGHPDGHRDPHARTIPRALRPRPRARSGRAHVGRLAAVNPRRRKLSLRRRGRRVPPRGGGARRRAREPDGRITARAADLAARGGALDTWRRRGRRPRGHGRRFGGRQRRSEGTLVPRARPWTRPQPDRRRPATRSRRPKRRPARSGSRSSRTGGGWMARVYLEDFGTSSVRQLVHCASPLNSVPEDVPGVPDQTRGICGRSSSRNARARRPLAAPRRRGDVLGGQVAGGRRKAGGCGRPELPRRPGVQAGVRRVRRVGGRHHARCHRAHGGGRQRRVGGGVPHVWLGSPDARPWYGTPRSWTSGWRG